MKVESLQSPVAFYAEILPALRAAAFARGYALGLHGSMQRDLDLIAVPWTEWACSDEELVGHLVEGSGGYIASLHQVEEKPHGRRAWTINFFMSGAHIDLSIIPRRAA